MAKIFKLYINKLHQIDPTYDALICAVKITAPGLAGFLCLIFFKNLFSFWIIMLPAFLFMIINMLPTPKQKFLNIAVSLSLLGIMQFSIAVLYIHPCFLVIVLFILALISLSSIKYRGAALFAILCAVIYLDLPQGWYLGVNRLIEIIVSGFIAICFIFIYDYLFSKIQLKSTIVYFSELLGDSFNILTTFDLKERRNLKYKYLLERPLSFKSEFEVEKIFKTDEEKYSHKLGMALTNKSNFIHTEKFIFKKDKEYCVYVFSIYLLLKGIYRSVAFMLQFNNHKTEIYKLYPSTDLLIDSINEAFKKIILLFRGDDCVVTIFFNDELVQNWYKECEKVNSKNIVIDDEILDSIYGIKCLISNFKEIEKILRTEKRFTY